MSGDIRVLDAYTDRIQKQYKNVSNTLVGPIIEFSPMGTPIIPSFEPTQDVHLGELNIFDRTISPTVEISRYQDDNSKVQTQRSHILLLAQP
jgi:hypothetical protein